MLDLVEVTSCPHDGEPNLNFPWKKFSLLVLNSVTNKIVSRKKNMT